MPDPRPDVLGLELETAKARLKAQGYDIVRVKSTGPPGGGGGVGKPRVLRQRWIEQGIELVVGGEMKLHD